MSKITPWVMTDEKLMRVYTEQMRDDLLHVSDEGRVPELVAGGLLRVLFHPGPHEVFELDGCGIWVFRDIVDGFKCQMSFFIWDKRCFGPDIVREAREVIVDIAKRHRLVKIETQTADERVVRLARMLLFEIEGYRVDSFLRGKERYGITLLGRSFQEEEDDVFNG
jgi:hypothetical protein